MEKKLSERFEAALNEGDLLTLALRESREILAALRRDEEAGWRTMDSAPKDGTAVELFRGPAPLGIWQKQSVVAVFANLDGDDGWFWPEEGECVELQVRVPDGTDWLYNTYSAPSSSFEAWRPLRPLPAPPKEG